uniref:Uncharacterized protein n=1 Tax=Parascaris equorum TaxID=6256 RepID=A0A914RRW9_PAREQ
MQSKNETRTYAMMNVNERPNNDMERTKRQLKKYPSLIFLDMSSAVIPISGTLAGCIGCMYFVESIANDLYKFNFEANDMGGEKRKFLCINEPNREEPGSMNLMTFSTFSFISLEGLLFTSKFFSVPNKIPLSFYDMLEIQLIELGSLLASLVMSKLLQGRQYSLRKYIAVMMITVGIIICTNKVENKKNTHKRGANFFNCSFTFDEVVPQELQEKQKTQENKEESKQKNFQRKKSSGFNTAEAAKHYREWLIENSFENDRNSEALGVTLIDAVPFERYEVGNSQPLRSDLSHVVHKHAIQLFRKSFSPPTTHLQK